MRSLLDRLREAYDVVIVDTPPVLPFSEAVHFAAHCDGTVLVANAGQTEIGAFEHATEKVKSVGAVLIGAVLNQFVAKPGVDYGYKYSYYYKSGYYKYSYYDRYYSDSESDSGKGKGVLARLLRREKTTDD
jgi:Mrp family chromosome partitioning ATPase